MKIECTQHQMMLLKDMIEHLPICLFEGKRCRYHNSCVECKRKRSSGKSRNRNGKMEYKDGIERISKHYGLNHQLRKLQEECGELIVAVNKYLDGDSPKNLIEEMADVSVMLDQVRILMLCGGEVDSVKLSKVNRQIERMRNEIS